MSSSKKIIYAKLEAFVTKYHFNQLIKGTLLFLAFGLFYFLFTISLEYFLWLSVQWRTALFWLFVTIELFLFIRFIVTPLLLLLKLRKGLDFKSASILIGNHFSDVSDTLLNFLQLSENENSSNSSELLAASIDQKASALRFVPFEKVVEYKRNYRLLPFALIPFGLFVYLFVVSENPIFSDSYNRFVQYNKPFSPPAPFAFVLDANRLFVKQGEDYVLDIKTIGSVLPSDCSVVINDQSYYSEQVSVNQFRYVFKNVQQSVSFTITANGVASPEYLLMVTKVPSVASFQMQLVFPSYLNKKAEWVSGSGNAVVPEGTKVNWAIKAEETNSIRWIGTTGAASFVNKNELFYFSKTITADTDYQISTSNQKVLDHEKLSYAIKVVKDQYPAITFQTLPDTVASLKGFLLGQVSDDYGLHKLQVVYYPSDNIKAEQRIAIPVKKELFDQFYFSLSQRVKLQEGVSYSYYFEVFDNDVLHNFKSVKSSLFSTKVQTDAEREEESLKNQSQTLSGLEQSLKNQDKQIKFLDKLEQLSKEKNQFDYKDQQKVQDFVEKQKRQENMMKEFSKKLQENLTKFQPLEKDKLKEELLNRLEKTDKQIDKNQQLIDEIKELNEKLNQDDLRNKLDKLKQQTKNQTKSLEQLLELTKKFYVEKKVDQLATKLDKLSEKQDKLSETNPVDALEKQKEIADEFDKIQKELNEVKKENQELKTPLSIPEDKPLEKNISDDLEKSSEELKDKKPAKAKPSQKAASKKMKKMSEMMQEAMDSGEAEQLEEDVKMLRQILDNLVTFSFSQETLLNQFKAIKRGSPSYAKYLKQQQVLKTQFKHVDDSLIALSMRTPVISDIIINEVGAVFYNVDKSIEFLSDAGLDRGVSHQQYTISSANKLADLLSDALTNMQMQMQMSASGKGKPKPGNKSGDMQLPDMMESQKGISEKIKKGTKPGEKPGQEGKQGQEGGQGQEGMSGEMFEVYKQQQLLRESLEKMLKQSGNQGMGNNAVNQMKQLEKQLLNKGFTKDVLQKAVQLNYELLKLDKAIQLQGQEDKRQAETNKSTNKNTNTLQLPASLKEYLQSIEILNRQKLPLRSNHENKVQHYFKSHD